MHKSKCPICGSTHTLKNGARNGRQLYKCGDCGYQFRNNRLPSESELWHQYQDGKQTVSELAKTYKTSESTIKRILRNISLEWRQPLLNGQSGYVHVDVTYWGHNWGVLLALDATTGAPLYIGFTKSETNADYIQAIGSIIERGFDIKGIVIDGRQSLFKLFSGYEIQMCQFHMKQIIRRCLTNNPRLKAAVALKQMIDNLTSYSRMDFEVDYHKWKETWRGMLERKSILKSGKRQFTHKRLRSAMHSIDFYLPFLFTYQKPGCKGMPNTNNKVEGIFTDLKRNLNNHSGMSVDNRKRFISGFFLALRNQHE